MPFYFSQKGVNSMSEIQSANEMKANSDKYLENDENYVRLQDSINNLIKSESDLGKTKAKIVLYIVSDEDKWRKDDVEPDREIYLLDRLMDKLTSSGYMITKRTKLPSLINYYTKIEYPIDWSNPTSEKGSFFQDYW